MRRFRVTGRFYVFMALVLVALGFIVHELVSGGAADAIVTSGSSGYNMVMDGVVVRDESVTSFEGIGRVEFIAAEGVQVTAGADVARVYTNNYADKSLNNLERIRNEIRAYHKIVLGNIRDDQLTILEANVQAQALEYKRLIQAKGAGSLVNVDKMLQQTMLERQEYLRTNQRQDHKLNSLYEAEAKGRSDIESWQTMKKADKEGTVSFYLDGYESALSFANLEQITPQDIRNVLAKKPLQQMQNARLRQSVFRIVSPGTWYVMLLSSDASWNPISGHTFQMQMQGVNGFAFQGTVEQVKKSGEDVLVKVRVDSDIGPLMGRRSGKINVNANLTGLSLPLKCIYTEDGKTGVRLLDDTFVQVEVLTMDTEKGLALVEPLVPGTLQKYSRVKMK